MDVWVCTKKANVQKVLSSQFWLTPKRNPLHAHTVGEGDSRRAIMVRQCLRPNDRGSASFPYRYDRRLSQPLRLWPLFLPYCRSVSPAYLSVLQYAHTVGRVHFPHQRKDCTTCPDAWVRGFLKGRYRSIGPLCIAFFLHKRVPLFDQALVRYEKNGNWFLCTNPVFHGLSYHSGIIRLNADLQHMKSLIIPPLCGLKGRVEGR